MDMIECRGIYLPAQETHLQAHIEAGPLFEGRGTYQYAKWLAAFALTQPDRRRVAVDVGAHVGLWSRVMAAHFAAVVAFEPIPAHAECWWRNVTAPNASLLQRALIDGVEGGSPFVSLTWAPGNTGSTALAGGHALEAEAFNPMAPPRQTIHAEADTLDRQNLPHLDFLKVDCEGAEELVILGGKETICRERPVIVVEQKKGHAPRHGLDDLGAVKLLQSWGAEVQGVLHGDYLLRWA